MKFFTSYLCVLRDMTMKISVVSDMEPHNYLHLQDRYFVQPK